MSLHQLLKACFFNLLPFLTSVWGTFTKYLLYFVPGTLPKMQNKTKCDTFFPWGLSHKVYVTSGKYLPTTSMTWRRNGNPLQYSCLGNPMDEEPGGLQSMGLQRLGHDWKTNTFTSFPWLLESYHFWALVSLLIKRDTSQDWYES